MSFLGEITSAGVGSLMSGVGQLAKDIRQAITGELPAEKQAEINTKLLEMELAAQTAQTKINEIEAANPSIFVSGWRPAAGWVCVGGFAYQCVVRPFLCWASLNFQWIQPPSLELDALLTLLGGLLGLGGYRMAEKVKGVARQ